MKRPSRFRSFLSFKSKTVLLDEAGGSPSAPNTVFQVWGHIGSATGNEQWVAQEQRSQTEVIIEIARRDDVNADMLVTDRAGRVFEVLAVPADDDTPRFMFIPCRRYRDTVEAPKGLQAVPADS